jgi:predicted 2-oxoglutarate/Fe(II)-dependent dioxygenase YbiX
MTAFTNFAENLLLDWMFTTGTAVRPTAWFVAIHLSDPGEDATGGEVIVADDADYIRKAVTFDAAASGQSLSTSAVTFTPAVAATAYTVTHISIWDASTVGNPFMKGALLVPRLIDNSNPLVISIGDLIAALD